MAIPRGFGMDKLYDHLKRGAAATADVMAQYLAVMQAGDISESLIVQMRERLQAWKDDYANSTAGVNMPALVDWAREVEDDPTFDPVAEWTALDAEVDAALATINANLTETFYTSAQTAAVGLQANLAAIVARVEPA